MIADHRPAARAVTLGDALETAIAELSELHDTGRLDAEVLLAHTLGKPRHHPYTFAEQRLTRGLENRYRSLIERRMTGEPVAYLIGEREFWSLTLTVTPDTLIPRPETERLVEVALELIPAAQSLRVADLGTGSGALAIAIASERAECEIVATDSSEAALEVARGNANRHGLSQIVFQQGDWCNALANDSFDLVISNPPYVREDDPHLSRGDVRFEPPNALVGGHDGLAAIRTICETAHSRLRPGGHLVLEHGASQKKAVNALLAGNGYQSIRHYQDHSKQDRVSRGRISGP